MFARVATKVFEWVINSTGGRLFVQGSHNECPKQELSENLMAVFCIFPCRLTGEKGVPGEKKKKLTTSSEQMSPLPSGLDATTTCFDEANIHGLQEDVQHSSPVRAQNGVASRGVFAE